MFRPPAAYSCGRGALLMEGTYGVYFGTKLAGKVQVRRQGLYYRFACRCRLNGEVVCRLRVTCGGRWENLGVVVPVDGGFGLETSLPVKSLGEGEPEFSLVPKHELPGGAMSAIYPEEPFSYIARFRRDFLDRQCRRTGIRLPEHCL